MSPGRGLGMKSPTFPYCAFYPFCSFAENRLRLFLFMQDFPFFSFGAILYPRKMVDYAIFRI